MRYRQQPSFVSKCLDSGGGTLSYLRKRPIYLCVLCIISIWMILAVQWTRNTNHSSAPNTNLSRNPHSNSNPNQLHLQIPDLVKDTQSKLQDVRLQPPRPPKLADKSSNALDAEGIADKVSNAKKVLVTYGQNCCASAKVHNS